jgi:pimeloyl-ACP methyl ester carboxylesterase
MNNDISRIETGFIETDGTNLYYEVTGEGHPLVLIHGGYMDNRMWDDQFAAFAERYRVVRYDVRGFGKTDLPRTPYTDRQDLYNLLTFLGISKTYLLGLSLGGVIAQDFTLEHPERVDALILVGAPIGGYPNELIFTPEQLQAQMRRWATFAKAIEERNRPAMVEAIMHDATLVPSSQYPAARQKVRDQLSEYSFVWVLDPVSQQQLEPPAYERLSEISVPTLIITGAEDERQLHVSADKQEQDISGS